MSQSKPITFRCGRLGQRRKLEIQQVRNHAHLFVPSRRVLSHDKIGCVMGNKNDEISFSYHFALLPATSSAGDPLWAMYGLSTQGSLNCAAHFILGTLRFAASAAKWLSHGCPN